MNGKPFGVMAPSPALPFINRPPLNYLNGRKFSSGRGSLNSAMNTGVS